jgi:rare lipoprotein A
LKPPVRLLATAAALGVAIVVAGCGTAPRAPARGGGYYQDDGPPEKVPADIMATPDAVPRIESFHIGASRPYVALGRSYTPVTDDRRLEQRGLASWYGRQFHGSRTSIGEIYDMFAMTAAHPTMPLPSYARVTNLRDGASVIVRVNDRGPFKDGRVIDLSYAAAVRLGIAAAGTGEVEVVRITNREIGAGTAPSAVAAAAVPVSPADPARQAAERWSVQIGAFSTADSARALMARAQAQLAARSAESSEDLQPRIESDGGLHRVLFGVVPQREAAAALAARLVTLLGGGVSTFVVAR